MRQMTALQKDIKNSRRGTEATSSNASANSLYPVSSAGVDGAGPVARGSCKQQQPVNKTSDIEHITHMGQDMVEPCSYVDPQIMLRAKKICDSHSASEGQVQAQEDEFFTWVVSFVKDYNPLERWTSNSLTAQYQKAHPTHIGYKSWIGTVTQFNSKRKGQRFTVPMNLAMIMSEAHPTAVIHSDDQYKYKKKKSKQNLGWPSLITR